MPAGGYCICWPTGSVATCRLGTKCRTLQCCFLHWIQCIRCCRDQPDIFCLWLWRSCSARPSPDHSMLCQHHPRCATSLFSCHKQMRCLASPGGPSAVPTLCSKTWQHPCAHPLGLCTEHQSQLSSLCSLRRHPPDHRQQQHGPY